MSRDGLSATEVAASAGRDRTLPRPFYFDRDALTRLAAERADAYARARPFPHAVIDGLLPGDVHDGVLAEFEAGEVGVWTVMRGGLERKLALRDETRMGDQTRHLFAQLKSSTFVCFLEARTGVRGLIPSVHFEGGGGLFQSERGRMMPVHVDFNRNDHPRAGSAARGRCGPPAPTLVPLARPAQESPAVQGSGFAALSVAEQRSRRRCASRCWVVAARRRWYGPPCD